MEPRRPEPHRPTREQGPQRGWRQRAEKDPPTQRRRHGLSHGTHSCLGLGSSSGPTTHPRGPAGASAAPRSWPLAGPRGPRVGPGPSLPPPHPGGPVRKRQTLDGQWGRALHAGHVLQGDARESRGPSRFFTPSACTLSVGPALGTEAQARPAGGACPSVSPSEELHRVC